MQIVSQTPSTQAYDERDEKELWRDCFSFSDSPSARPGPAALVYAVALISVAAAELFQLPENQDGYLQGHAAFYAAYLIAACLPLIWVLAGLRRRRIWQTPPVLLAATNVLPCISGVLRHVLWSVPDSLQYDLLKVATLHVVTALLFPTGLLVKAVTLSLSTSLVVAAVVVDSVLSDMRAWPVLVEASLLYLALSSTSLAAWSPADGGPRQTFNQAVQVAFSVQQQDVICWNARHLFNTLLSDASDSSQQPLVSPALLRQRLIRQLNDVGYKAEKTYNLSRDMRSSLSEVVSIIRVCIERSVATQDAKINVDVSNSPAVVQDWLTQNFSRSISVESSMANPEIPPSPSHVDVKKAARKYLRHKFQSGGSVVAVEPIPEHAQKNTAEASQAAPNPQNGGAATEDGDLSFPATVSAMMAALDYSSTEGAPSLVPEETAGVLMAQIGNWDFNVVGFSEVVGSQTLRFMAKVALEPFAERLGIPIGQRPNVSSLECVLRSLESRYLRTNPYHNGVHAADVLNSFLYYLGYFSKSGNLFSDREIFAALLSSAAHDVGHDGKSSRYHMTTESPLALLYSDQSVLEMLHCSILFAVLRSRGTDILNDWDFDSRQAFRKQVIRMILDTDLAKHFEQVKTFREKYLETETTVHPEERTPEQKQDILSFVLKLSDIGGSAKPFALHAQWATRINAEFFLQGDLEREVGLPCSPFCDRKVHKVAESQQGFYTYIVSPLYDCLSMFMRSPRLDLEVMQNIQSNITFWKRYDGCRFNYNDPVASAPDLVKLFLASGAARVSSDAEMPVVSDDSMAVSQEDDLPGSSNRMRAQSQGLPRVQSQLH